jgi:hypothetical protein
MVCEGGVCLIASLVDLEVGLLPTLRRGLLKRGGEGGGEVLLRACKAKTSRVHGEVCAVILYRGYLPSYLPLLVKDPFKNTYQASIYILFLNASNPLLTYPLNKVVNLAICWRETFLPFMIV